MISDWRNRSEINGDVVFFRYAKPDLEKRPKEIFIWDLDKTYLDTKIDSISGLLQTILEKAFHKKNIPGTSVLIQNIAQFREQAGKKEFPIYFITASPPQMEERISEKFKIDKIRPYGCFYKDNLSNLRPKRFWRLTKQVGYKLQALMQLRLRLNDEVRQICWGDDSESDAIIYNLYSDICSRRLGANDIRMILEKLNVTGDQVDTILMLQSQVPENDPVDKIYINLAVDTDPDYYLKFGRRTLPTYNSFQVALDLVQDQRLGKAGLLNVTNDMIQNYRFTPEELMKSFDELVRRGVIGESFYNDIVPLFIENKLAPQSYHSSVPPLKEKTVINGHLYELEGTHEPWVQDHIDYTHDYR